MALWRASLFGLGVDFSGGGTGQLKMNENDKHGLKAERQLRSHKMPRNLTII
jgi:hypothetical protein